MTQGSLPTNASNQTASAITSQVKETAGEVADQAKKVAASKLGAGKDFAAESLGTLAQALHKTGEELHDQQSAVSDYLEKAASSIESVSDYFQTRTLSQVAGDLQGFARREPALYLGGAFLAGLLGGRLLKAATPAAADLQEPRSPRRLPGPTARLPENDGGAAEVAVARERAEESDE